MPNRMLKFLLPILFTTATCLICYDGKEMMSCDSTDVCYHDNETRLYGCGGCSEKEEREGNVTSGLHVEGERNATDEARENCMICSKSYCNVLV